LRVVRREEHGAEAVRVDHGARARRVGREAVAGPALVLAELAAAAVEARVAPPHVDTQYWPQALPTKVVHRRLEPCNSFFIGPRDECNTLARPPEETTGRMCARR